MSKTKLMLGDNITSLRKLPDNSIDSIVTDPPYGLSFMGKKWDYDVPSVEFWKEVYRVLKPGGHILSFGGTRTYHRMVVNIEDAGFEIRDQVMWLYGSGFPKSHNISKALDKLEGKEREVVGERKSMAGGVKSAGGSKELGIEGGYKNEANSGLLTSNEPISDSAKKWNGYGTALKPSNEPICVARKPLSEKSVAENVIKWGTGGINIDGCRIGTDTISTIHNPKITGKMGQAHGEQKGYIEGDDTEHEGRFPANIILDETAAELLDEQSGFSKTNHKGNRTDKGVVAGVNGFGRGTEVARQDSGGASRFFYVAKVSKKERNLGLDGFEEKIIEGRDAGQDERNVAYKARTSARANTHPTVKPINLMTYLCRLITPEGGIVLDPFMGSGSTGIAARLEGFKFLGMEMDKDYYKIAEARIEAYEQYRDLLK